MEKFALFQLSGSSSISQVYHFYQAQVLSSPRSIIPFFPLYHEDNDSAKNSYNNITMIFQDLEKKLRNLEAQVVKTGNFSGQQITYSVLPFQHA